MSTNEPPEYPDYGSVPDQGGTPPPPPPSNQPPSNQPPSYQAPTGGYGPPSMPPPGAPGGYGPYGPVPQSSQKALWSMIIGILSLLCCGLAGIASIIMGQQAKREIAASNGYLTGSGQAQAGFILGIVAVSLTVLGILFYVVVIGFAVSS